TITGITNNNTMNGRQAMFNRTRSFSTKDRIINIESINGITLKEVKEGALEKREEMVKVDQLKTVGKNNDGHENEMSKVHFPTTVTQYLQQEQSQPQLQQEQQKQAGPSWLSI